MATHDEMAALEEPLDDPAPYTGHERPVRPTVPGLVVQVRALLPVVLLVAAFINFSLPSLVYLLVFLQLMHVPRYGINPRVGAPFPYSILTILLLYSFAMIANHITSAVLMIPGTQPATLSITEASWGLPRYDLSVWLGLRTLLGHVLVFFLSILSFLQRHEPTKKRYIVRCVQLLWFSVREVLGRMKKRREQAAHNRELPFNVSQPIAAHGGEHFFPSRASNDLADSFSDHPHSSTPQASGESLAPLGPSIALSPRFPGAQDGTQARRTHSDGASSSEYSPDGDQGPETYFRSPSRRNARNSSRTSLSSGPLQHAGSRGFNFLSPEILDAVLDGKEPDDSLLAHLYIDFHADGGAGHNNAPLTARIAREGAQALEGFRTAVGRGAVTAQRGQEGPRRSRRFNFFETSQEGFDIDDERLFSDEALARERSMYQNNSMGSIPPEPHPLGRMTRFLSGRGGLLWSSMSIGLAGISYSSILTVLLLLPVLVTSIAKAFKGPAPLFPKRRVHKLPVILAVLRVYVGLYIAALYTVQIGWFQAVRNSNIGVLIGLVPLNTDIPRGWANVMAVGAATFGYVMLGMFAKALRTTLRHDELKDYYAERRIATLAETEASLDMSENSAPEQESGLLIAVPRAVAMRTVRSIATPPKEPETRLSNREEHYLRIAMHLSSLGLLTWALVFPGILSLPLLCAAFAYFSIRSWWMSHRADLLVVYAGFLQLVSFMYAAAADAYGIEDSSWVRLLGLRRFQPQFAMNVVQLLAVGLFCINMCLKRYLLASKLPTSNARTGKFDLTDFIYFTTYSVSQLSLSKAAFSPIRVLIDHLALASLFVTGAAQATPMHAVFLVALVIICFLQGWGLLEGRDAQGRVRQHGATFSVIWIAIGVYSGMFLVLNSLICRAASDLWECDYQRIGILVATTPQTIAYACTVVFAALQAQMRWPWGQDHRDTVRIQEFAAPFGVFAREYFIYVAYAVLLLYPIVYPANYLSYVYMVFLWLMIFIKIVLPDSHSKELSWQASETAGESSNPLSKFDSQRIVQGVWPTVVAFAGLAMLARYFVRFPQFERDDYIQLWVFGLERRVSGFAMTVGDTVVLIMMALQGRLFVADRILASAKRIEHSSDESLGGYSSEARSMPAALAQTHAPNVTFADLPEYVAEGGQKGLSAKQAAPSESAQVETAMQGLSWHQFAQFTDTVRKMRQSMPVRRTYDFLATSWGHFWSVLRGLLLGYNYVFEALAILGAAVWLNGISVFGLVYLVCGCVLIFTTQGKDASAPRRIGQNPWRWLRKSSLHSPDMSNASWLSQRVLPPVLVILSFGLMSIQYLYLILVSSGVEWSAFAEYLGLETVPRDPSTGQPDLNIVPIEQDAMIAHVLVFVMAFLQRTAVRWDTMVRLRAMREGQVHNDFEHVANPMQPAADALQSAVSISLAVDGVAADRALPDDTEGGAPVLAGHGQPEPAVGDNTILDEEDDLLRRGPLVGTSQDHGDAATKRALSFHVDAIPESPVSNLRRSSPSYSDFGAIHAGAHGPSADQDMKTPLSETEWRDGTTPGALTRRTSERLYRNPNTDGDEARVFGRYADGSLHPELFRQPFMTEAYPDGNDFANNDVYGGVSQYFPVQTESRGWLSPIRKAVRESILFVFRTIGDIFSLLKPFWGNWGFDVTFIYLVVGAAVSETVFSVIYVLFVLALGGLSKARLRKHWSWVTLSLIALVLVQYGLTLGVPPLPSSETEVESTTRLMSEAWVEWLYIDSLSQKTVYENASNGRKAGITFGFLAVICAGLTLRAIPEISRRERQEESRRAFQTTDRGQDSMDVDALEMGMSPVRVNPQAGADGGDEAGPSESGGLHVVDRKGTPPTHRLHREISGLGDDRHELLATTRFDYDYEFDSRNINRTSFDIGGVASADSGSRISGLGDEGRLAYRHQTVEDFTRRPLTFKNWIKLSWMRFAGSLVQLFMLGVAAVDTNLMSFVLLLAAFGFFLQFTNTKLKQTHFSTIRTYVLITILVLVAYQAPFEEPEEPWPRILGLYKSSSGNPLLYFLLALWILCQMQGRIYGSRNFVFVEKYAQEDEAVRHKRAGHEHSNRLYEKMLERNKYFRAKAAREARVNALETLRERTNEKSTDLLYRVCVKNWVHHLKAEAASDEHKERKAIEKKARDEDDQAANNCGPRERFARYLMRGSKWRKYAKFPFQLELRSFATRYSSFPVYLSMILAVVIAPSVLTIVYPIVMFVYLVLEQPRPPKQAWTLLILYVYFVILWKYFGRKFEFFKCEPPVAFFWFYRSTSEAKHVPNVSDTHICAVSVGIFFDILVLLSLLWHRTILYYRGLWDRSNRQRRVIQCVREQVTRKDMQFQGFAPAPTASPRTGLPEFARQEEDTIASVPVVSVSSQEQIALTNNVRFQSAVEIAQMCPGTPDTFDSDTLATYPTWRDAQSPRNRPFATPIRNGPSRESTLLRRGASAVRDDRNPSQSMGAMFGDRANRSTGDSAARSSGTVEERGVGFRRRSTTLGASGSRYDARAARNGLDQNVEELQRLGLSRVQSGLVPEEPQDTMLSRLTSRITQLGQLPNIDSSSEPDTPTDPEASAEASLVKALRDDGVIQPLPNREPRSGGVSGDDAYRATGLSTERSMFGISGLLQHFRRLTEADAHKAVGDYYILIFAVDFTCFVYMMFGYSSIFDTEQLGDAPRTWWENNFIETNQLVALLLMFVGIVLDRVLYLRRSMFGKLLLQYISVFVYHYVLFIMTNIGTSNHGKAFYLLKCVYFLLSGLQIRAAFPKYTTGQYLLRDYSTPGIVLFEIYNYIPFLWLTRTLLDWAVLKTSLEIFQYFRFIDIYMWLYRNRAINTARGRFRRQLGEKRRLLPRVYQGAGLFLLCVILLFFPFFLFSLFNPFFSPRTLQEASLSMSVVGRGATHRIFTRSTAIESDVSGSSAESEEVRERFTETYGITPVVREREELFAPRFSIFSDQMWIPSEPDVRNLVALLRDLENPAKISVTLSASTVSQVFRTVATADMENSTRLEVADAVETNSQLALRVTSPLEKYLFLTSGSNDFEAVQSTPRARETCLRLLVGDSSEFPIGFWALEDCVTDDCVCEVLDEDEDADLEAMLAELSDVSEHSVDMLLQIAEVSSLSFGGGTILTVYAAILFTVASVAKSFLANKRLVIPYIDMPYTLHLYQLVVDIVYARQDEDLVMEEILYNGLIDIYRDPSELARWTGQRALKLPSEWWEQGWLIESYDGYPSFRETDTEPYIERVVD